MDSQLFKENHCSYQTPTTHNYKSHSYLVIKRTFDILFSLSALCILALPSLLIMLLIRLDSSGPALFTQERLGRNGKKFLIYKFRTMYMNAEENGPQFAVPGDKRCTKIGAFLRKTRIDEWPQFYNILCGDMSLVGPRPEREHYYLLLNDTIPDFTERLLVKPGLTGYAQVYGGLQLSPEEKIIFDQHYVKHCSIALDLRCMMRTVVVLFRLLVCKNEE